MSARWSLTCLNSIIAPGERGDSSILRFLTSIIRFRGRTIGDPETVFAVLLRAGPVGTGSIET